LAKRLGYHPDDYFDLTGVADPYDFIRQQFNYSGERYAEQEQAQLVRMLDQAEPLIDAGRCKEAAALLNSHPQFVKSIELNVLAALINGKVGQKQNALAIARDMLRKVRLNSWARLRLAEVFRDCGEYRETLATLRPLRGADLHAPTAAYLYGLTLDDLGAYAAALNHLQFCRQKVGDTPSLLNDLGVVYKNNRQFEEAEDCFRLVLDVQPNSLLTLANLAVLLEKQGLLSEADQFAKRGYQLHPRFDQLIDSVQKIPPPRYRRTAKPGEMEITCDRCKSIFRMDAKSEKLCGGCGSVHDAKQCPCCGDDAFVPVPILFMNLPVAAELRCPVCRSGTLKSGGSPRAKA